MALSLLLPSLLFFSTLTTTREIIFPPLSPYQSPHHHDDPPTDITQTDTTFSGLTTYANLPWAPCLSAPTSTNSSTTHLIPPYDIALLGAPFDTATTFRPGARFGPSAIRLGSRRIAPAFAYSPFPPHSNPFRSWASILDCGDAPLTFLDNTVALRQLEDAHRVIATRKPNATSIVDVPRIVTLGGDHTTTLSALRAAFVHWGVMSVIHFDSHIDTWDPRVLGGGVSHYAGVNHGTFLHIAHEEGLVGNDSSAHVGIRAPLGNKRFDLENDVRCGFEIVAARDIDRIGVDGVVRRLKERVKRENVYVSVDIDVLDPAFAPGTGTPEVGGWTSRELLGVLEGLNGLRVVGADVVEVAPAYDGVGGATGLVAAEVVKALLGLMIETPVNSREVGVRG